MPKYAKFLKGLLSNKARLEEACTVKMNERCSAVLHLHIDNALADLRASISLMPYTVYEKLGLGEPKPTRMSLELADKSIQYPRGIAKDVLIKIDKFVLPVDFVILDMRGGDLLEFTLILDSSYKSTALRRLGENDYLEDGIYRPVWKNRSLTLEIPIRFFQIPIAPEDQAKTTFTCPYGTFAYRRMPFRLCNVLVTFQRCEETNLVLNWEKCHFMVNEGIVLGQKISGKGIEVDKAKIDVISKLPYPTNVKGVRSFLGHAGKKDAKLRIIRWVLLLQGFNIERKDKKGAENLAADHLSRLENLWGN
ncbi:reverse transcriptase domain-containing protein [Tanacetum coccineum]